MATRSGFLALLRSLVRRMPRRLQFRIVLTVSILFVLVAFTESCVHFYGADMGELPSPAVAWAWNMNAMFINSARVYANFCMMILAGVVFSDCAQSELRKGSAAVIASRMSVRSFVIAHGVVSFMGGFLLVLLTLGALQLLAFIAFPIEGAFEGGIGVPAYRDYGSVFLLSDLYRSSPYLYNAVFALWTAVWCGLSAFLSFGISLLMRRALGIALVLPTLAVNALFVVIPMVLPSGSGIYLFFNIAFPNHSVPPDALIVLVLAPIALALMGCVSVAVALRRKGDLLL